jgi:signal transduction histidine kinase
VRARAGAVCFQSGEKLAVTFSDEFSEDARRDYGTLPVDAPLPTTETVRTGRGVWLGSAAEIDRRFPHLAKVRERWGDRAWACTPLRLEGEPLGVLGLAFREERAFDPSERAFIASLAQLCADAFARARRHEAEHAARARAEAAEEAARRAATLQDQVLAVVGHDLRTPLSSITMAVAMARRRSPADDRLSASLDRIARSGRRMNEIIRDLLDVARARQGIGMALTRRPISAQDVCEQAIAELQHVHPGRAVGLSVSGDLRIEGDGSRLLQAVSNLVGNALQHGAHDAQVSVEAAGDPEGIVIRVRNGGAPIPDALLDEIFEPFRRGNGADDSSGSLGLGLFVVREIARAHGGSVSVSSDPTGTTFELRILRTCSTELPANLHG